MEFGSLVLIKPKQNAPCISGLIHWFILVKAVGSCEMLRFLPVFNSKISRQFSHDYFILSNSCMNKIWLHCLCQPVSTFLLLSLGEEDDKNICRFYKPLKNIYILLLPEHRWVIERIHQKPDEKYRLCGIKGGQWTRNVGLQSLTVHGTASLRKNITSLLYSLCTFTTFAKYRTKELSVSSIRYLLYGFLLLL